MRGPSIPLWLLVSLLMVSVSPLASPAGAQEGATRSTNLVLSDPAGDVGPLDAGLPANPVSGAYGHIDITRVEIGNEAGGRFEIVFEVVGVGDPAQAATRAVAATDVGCTAQWTYRHDLSGVDYFYELSFSGGALMGPASEPSNFRADYYFRYNDDNGGVGRGFGGFDSSETVYDPDTNAFIMTVDKGWVPVWPGGHAPGSGDTMVLQGLSCETDIALVGTVRDSVDLGETTQYDFQSAGANSLIGVGFREPVEADVASDPRDWEPPYGGGSPDATPVVAVAPGVATKVPVFVSNNADARKLLQLEAAFHEDGPTGWNVSLTPSIMVPAGDVRTVNLIITPTGDAALGETFPLRLMARAAGEDLQTAAEAVVRVAPVVDAEHNTLFLHSRAIESGGLAGPVIGEVVQDYRLGASLLDNDPMYGDEPVAFAPVQGFYGRHLLDPLVRPVRLDAANPVLVTLAFEGDPARRMAVEINLLTEHQTVLSLDTTVPADGVTEIEAFIPAEGQLDLPAGAELHFEMDLYPANIVPDGVEEVRFIPDGSHIRLPIVRNDESFIVTDGRFLPSLALARGEEANTYLNPGKEYAFDLVLSNEGVEADDIRLGVEAANATGWDVEVKPGKTFRVQPGNSTPFSVVVKAPGDATEGDHPTFDVVARSTHDPAVQTTIRLDAVVTTGVEVEGKAYAEKEGQLEPLEEETGESPAPVLVLALGALAGLAVAIRRRR